MTETQFANALVTVTARLIELMRREIELLRAMRPAEIEALQPAKTALVQAYDEHLHELRRHPERVAAMEPVVRDELWRVAQDLEKTVTENGIALRAAAEANARLVSAVVDAAQSRARDNGSYTKAAKVAPRPAEGDVRILSLSLDRQL